VPNFKIGDKVYVRRDVYTGVSPKFLDYDRAYTVIKNEHGTLMLDGGLEGFGFVGGWLLPAKCEIKVKECRIKDVKFSGPATIVFWTDGTKTVVKCGKGDKFDPEKGIAMACAKKLLGNEDGYHREIAKYAKPVKKSEPPKDTEELRFIVNSSCRAFTRCDLCPCRLNGGDEDCHIIAFASREVLLEMYHSFEKAGKLWKGESNA
jgi:hypothetical protein